MLGLVVLVAVAVLVLVLVLFCLQKVLLSLLRFFVDVEWVAVAASAMFLALGPYFRKAPVIRLRGPRRGSSRHWCTKASLGRLSMADRRKS